MPKYLLVSSFKQQQQQQEQGYVHKFQFNEDLATLSYRKKSVPVPFDNSLGTVKDNFP